LVALRRTERDTLELEKLKEEVAAMRLPWWKRPVYIAAVFPTILGIVAVLAAFISGAAKAQYDLVQYQKQTTESQKFQNDKDQLALAKDQKKLEEQRASLEKEKQRMTNEISELKKAHDVEVAELSRKKAVAKVVTHLDAIEAAGDQLWPLHNSVGAIITLLKSDKGRLFRPEVESRLKQATNVLLQSHLLMILYLGTTNTNWKDQLWQIACRDPESKPWHYWLVFGSGAPWSNEDGIQVVELLTGILSTNVNMTISQKSEIMQAIESRLPLRYDKILRSKFTSRNMFFDAVEHARNQLLNTNWPYYYRVNGLGVLVKLAPQVCVVSAATAFQRHESDLNMIGRIYDAINGEFSELREFAISLGCPTSTDAGAWGNWLITKKQLVDEATEPNLDTWRKDPTKYDKWYAP
jgi:hypothetical protein